MGGLVGVILVVSSYGRRIDLVGGKGARLGLGGLGEAGRALGVAANSVALRHDLNCRHKERASPEINAPGRKRRPMGAPRRGRTQIFAQMGGK